MLVRAKPIVTSCLTQPFDPKKDFGRCISFALCYGWVLSSTLAEENTHTKKADAIGVVAFR